MQKNIYLVFIILIFSCSNQQKKSNYTLEQIASLHLDSTEILTVVSDSAITIDINPFLGDKSFDFSSLVKEIKFVPLETIDESLVSDIYKVIVTDSSIYIMDNYKGAGLIIFDSKGKFIKRIKQGQGPQELLRLYDIAFDPANNELIAYQHSFLVYFTANGEFIRKKRLPFGFYNFAVMSNGYIYKVLEQQNNHLEKFNPFSLLVSDTSFSIKYAALPKKESDVNLVGYNYLYPCNDSSITVTQHYNDTIYSYNILNNNILKAKYVMNYSNKKLPDEYLEGSMQQFDDATKNNDYYYYLGKYFETDNHNIIFIENNMRGQTVIYRDKKSGNTVGGNNAIYNIDEIPPVAFPVSVFGNYFVSSVLPDNNMYNLLSNSSVILDEDKLKLRGLSEDDNPVLVLYTLKEF